MHSPAMNVVAPWLHLAYIIPHLYTDMDAYQFYRVAPEGAMLLTTGLDLKEYSLAAVEKELPVLRQRFELLAKKNVDRIALSGVPVAAALGRQRMRGILDEAQARTGVAYLLISHDLAVVRAIARTVAIMDQGRIVEAGPVAEIFAHPTTDTTRRLLAAVPRLTLPPSPP